MSKVEKIFIQGIRSFSYREGSCIKFDTPLTIIVGQNGAGKTTIIECLKYASTGEIPPMSKGGAFIHDPKLTPEAEIKAKVKLQFRDRAGRQVIVSRIRQATQKSNKVETKTLDSTMEKVVNGERVQVTSRCADVDEEMMNHLGVSKAVLNNVLFCHQEDSTWPLSESKVLKKKFDAIFDASKYSKALENVKEIMRQQNQKARECKGEVKYLEDYRKKADEYAGDLRQTEQKIEQQKRTLTRLDEELKPVEERLRELDGLFDEVAEMEKEIASLISRRDQIEKDARELSLKIKDHQPGSVEELEEKHANYNLQLERKRKALQKVREKMESLNGQRRALEDEVSRLYNEHGKLLAEAERQKERKEEIERQVRMLSSQLELKGVGTTGSISEDTIRRFLVRMQERIAEMEESAKLEKESFVKEEGLLQGRIDELIHSLATSEQSHRMKQQQKEENETVIAKQTRQLQAMCASSASLVNLEEELKAAEAVLAKHNSNVDLSSLDEQLSSLQSEKTTVDRAMRDLQEELTRATKQAEVRGAIKELKKDKGKKEEEMATMENSMRSDLLTLFNEVPAAGELGSKLERLLRMKNGELEKAKKSLSQARRHQSDQEATKRMKTKELTSAKERLTKLEGIISSICGSQAYEDALRENEQEIHKTQEDITGTRGSEPFFKMCIDKVEQTKKCPVCTRKFDAKAESTKCVENLRQRISTAIPRILTGLQESLGKLETKRRQLLGLKPNIEEVKDLRSRRIPALEGELTQATHEVDRCQEDVMEYESNVTIVEGSLQKIQSLQHRAVALVQLSESLDHLKGRIRLEEGKIPSSARGATRDQTIVTRDLKKKQSRSDDLSREIDSLREEIDENVTRQRNLEAEVYELREKKFKFLEQVSQKQQLQRSKNELEAKNDELSKELESIKGQLQPLERDKKSAEKEKRDLAARKEDAVRTSRSKIDELQSKYQNVRTLDADIKRFVERGCASAVERSKRDMDTTKEELEQNKQESGELQKDRNELESSLSSAEVRLRELEDSIQLVKKQSEVKRLVAVIHQKEQEMKQRGFDEFEEEYHRLQTQRRELEKKKGTYEGACDGLEVQVVRLKRELNEDRLKYAVRNYKHMQVDIKTIEASVSDVDKLYNALDKAIMKYHAAKMEEINEYIKELWTKIYRGNDIDYVMIKSEDDLEDSAQQKRKTYKYRVVMNKGSTELDMRGRCSAGQKMLASIIIRLALAETFSYECGVLALDEPTTNLDNDNKEGLAAALADIVRERQTQRNFQLIVITHDDEFVDMLGRSDFVDDYYHVSKDSDGVSSVSRLSFATSWKR